MKEKRGGAAPRQLSGRGLAYWSDGKGRTHSLCDAGLSADLPQREKMESAFRPLATKVKWTLKLNDDQEILPDLTTGEIGIQSAPVVAKRHGDHRARRFREGMTPRSMRK